MNFILSRFLRYNLRLPTIVGLLIEKNLSVIDGDRKFLIDDPFLF